MSQTMLQMPLFTPKSDWRPPSEFPDLTHSKRIAIDLETCDPKLKGKGPGSIRRDGYILGVAVATDTFTGYYPLRHFDGGNFDEKVVFTWLKDQLSGTQPKVGANLLYDLEWLRTYGVKVNGPIYDVQVAEPLLDEESLVGYSLDVLANKYLGNGKFEEELREAAKCYGVDPKKEMWRLPARFVGKYAEFDTTSCLQIIDKQLAEIEKQGLRPIWELESSLVPILLEMRFKGVRVNLKRAEQLRDDWVLKEKELQSQLNTIAGWRVNAWAGADIGKFINQYNAVNKGNEIHIQTTSLGNPSFTADWVKFQGHPFFKKLQELRSLSKMRRDFVESMVLENQVNGRIHTQFHQLKKDAEGTRSGRFSSTNPNLQQVPSRDDVIAPLIRGLFIPEDGCKWAKMDYSQQEPRVLLHYAASTGKTGAAQVLQMYKDNPRTDWYKIIQDGAQLSRKDSKDATLGRFYGMGIPRFAARYNKSEDEAERILKAFDALFPFVKELSWDCIGAANERGWIRTILGRKRHFNKWACKKGLLDDGQPANTGEVYDTPELAMQAQPGAQVTRAFVHKALNSLIQGSSGDMTKKAMIDIYEQTGEIMHLTVHDELDASVEDEAHARKLKEIKEHCVTKLVVPIVSDLSMGDNWGSVKKLL